VKKFINRHRRVYIHCFKDDVVLITVKLNKDYSEMTAEEGYDALKNVHNIGHFKGKLIIASARI